MGELDHLLGERLFGAGCTATAIARDTLPLLDLAHGDASVAAVVLYGSRLFPGSPDSEPDYYVIVDSLRAFHRDLASALANLPLPPSVYHLPIRTLDGPRTCKASVISTRQLQHETSPRARDLHHLGRFSKPLALLFARDDAAFRLVRDAQISSLTTLAPLAISLLGPRFTAEEFMMALLGLSYRGEHRIFEPGKVRAILDADRSFGLRVARLLLTAERITDCDGWYRRPAHINRRSTLRLIARSRLRDLARWPRYMATFDGWLDYVQRKLERHCGRPLELTPRQKRFPLLFGWPALLSLRRQGLLR